ncbi:MAG: hypothetical protein MZV70_61310 [Desulfobacterales bacterium]|nr:hypothetical protein [Desulfobacterales bacterium]
MCDFSYRFAQLKDRKTGRSLTPLVKALSIPEQVRFLDEALEPGIGLCVHVSYRRAAAEVERIGGQTMSHTHDSPPAAGVCRQPCTVWGPQGAPLCLAVGGRHQGASAGEKGQGPRAGADALGAGLAGRGQAFRARGLLDRHLLEAHPQGSGQAAGLRQAAGALLRWRGGHRREPAEQPNACISAVCGMANTTFPTSCTPRGSRSPIKSPLWISSRPSRR